MTTARHRSALWLAVALAVPLATAVRAEDDQDFDALPDSISRYVQDRSECFLPGELDHLDDTLDDTRVAVPGCAKGMLPPQQAVASARVYKKGKGPKSTVDCASMRQNEFNTRYLDLFLRELVRVADSDSPAGAECAAGMIHAWATADAMTRLGEGGDPLQTKTDVMWTYGGISAAYLAHPAVRDAARAMPGSGDKTADGDIVGWFRTLSDPVTADIDKARASGKENNLQYWRGFAILSTALLAQDPKLLTQSRKAFEAGIGQITYGAKDPRDDGYLPLELVRGEKAQSYSTFASQPLVGSAVLSRAYGCDFLNSNAKRDRLAALLERNAEGVFDADLFQEELKRQGIGKNVKVKTIKSTNDVAGLLYLIDGIDPDLFDRIDRDLARSTGKPRPVVAPKDGARRGESRLGGTFANLLAASDALHDQPPGKLSKVCGKP